MVKVTQADRDAVQAFHRAMAEKLFADITSGEPPTFGDDAGHDGDTIHQALARHREAAEADMETRFWSIVDPNSVPSDMWEALDRLAQAYRERAASKAREAALVGAVERHLKWLNNLPIPTTGCTAQMIELRAALPKEPDA